MASSRAGRMAEGGSEMGVPGRAGKMTDAGTGARLDPGALNPGDRFGRRPDRVSLVSGSIDDAVGGVQNGPVPLLIE
ncbi:MAG TPA: hypothetical protein VM942_01685 [Acidimicrobiales bacterium]|nr:hypothetical protein [Acidimicrobiales bacterium]